MGDTKKKTDRAIYNIENFCTQRAIKIITSGIFRWDPSNLFSHNVHLEVKKGYIMVPRKLRWSRMYWLRPRPHVSGYF